jgi:hypothetical protein
MEPQYNPKLALTKAISAHEQAEASLADLMENFPDGCSAAMMERVRQNLEELRQAAAAAESAEP